MNVGKIVRNFFLSIAIAIVVILVAWAIFERAGWITLGYVAVIGVIFWLHRAKK